MQKSNGNCAIPTCEEAVRTVTRFYTENTSKKDLVRQLGVISIGHTLDVIDINFDQKT